MGYVPLFLSHQHQPSLHLRLSFILDAEMTKLTTNDTADVGKTLPSRFQQRDGSLRATPASRSEHTDKCVERDGAFHDKHAEIKDKPLFSVSSREKRGSKGIAESGDN